MKDQIKQIRRLLTHFSMNSRTKERGVRDPKGGAKTPVSIKPGAKTPGADQTPRAPHGVTQGTRVRLSKVIQEIVDDLQPLLSAHQAAFYWYLFRHSILANGKPLIRTGSRTIQRGVVKPQRRGVTVAQSSVRKYLMDLERVGAIRKEGESNRSGTLYRVLMPAEIEACVRFRAERTARRAAPEIAESEIDYYNVRENRRKVYERDDYKCRYCGKQLTRLTATLDHIVAVAEGGGNHLDNLVTACLGCNSRKYKRPVGDFLAERSVDVTDR